MQAENVADLVADTLKNLGKPYFTDVSSQIQDHVAMHHLLQENRVVLESGTGIQFNVLVGQSNAARGVSLGQSDNTNQVDGMIQASANWRHCQTSYSIIRQEMEMNREPARIVDFVKQQRLMGLISLAEYFESTWWGAPVASDTINFYGLPYTVVKNATKGFTGGAPTGFTTKFGINPAFYPGPQWNNFAFPYTNVTRDDFIRGCREAATRTKFKPPVDGIPTPNTGDDYGLYTNYSVIQPLEEACESQNDNLGVDIAKYDGKVVFRHVPVMWVPWLDRDTTNPIYGINWGWMKIYILADEWMRETHVPMKAGQHTVSEHFIDCSLQPVSKSVRENFVGSNGTSMPA